MNKAKRKEVVRMFIATRSDVIGTIKSLKKEINRKQDVVNGLLNDILESKKELRKFMKVKTQFYDEMMERRWREIHILDLSWMDLQD